MSVDLEVVVAVVFIFILLILLTTYAELKKRPKRPEYETKELLECEKCKYRLVQDFEPGDFVSMYKSKCPRCGEPARIKAIYNVEKALKQY